MVSLANELLLPLDLLCSYISSYISTLAFVSGCDIAQSVDFSLQAPSWALLSFSKSTDLVISLSLSLSLSFENYNDFKKLCDELRIDLFFVCE